MGHSMIDCVHCGMSVNELVAACPGCGGDPRTPGDAGAAGQGIASKTFADALQERDEAERYEMLSEDPVQLAAAARDAGMRVLHLELREKYLRASRKAAVAGSARFVLDAIEAEGWELDSWHVVYVPTGITAALVGIGAVGLGGNHVEGETLCYYLFRRAD